LDKKATLPRILPDKLAKALIERIERGMSARRLNAPPLALFNGTSAILSVGAGTRVMLPVVGSPAGQPDRLVAVEAPVGTMFWVRATASPDRRSSRVAISPYMSELKTIPGGHELLERTRTVDVTLRDSDWILIPMPPATVSRLTGAKEVVDAKTGKKHFELVKKRLEKQPDGDAFYVLVKAKVVVQREHEVPASAPTGKGRRSTGRRVSK